MISNYLKKLSKHYASGHASEHTYRGDLAELISMLVPSVDVTNEPTKVTECGNPDYVITRNRIPVGFIEAKDVGKDLDSKQYEEQFDRYRKALDNLIITDYIHFRFYRNGKLVRELRIAEVQNTHIVPVPENFDEFENLLGDFCFFVTQTIKSPRTLAELMAAKARLLESILEKAVTSDDSNEENTALNEQYATFKNILIHDLSPKGFADIYAQTLAYGMFAARLHDNSLDTFSRQEAAELIPKSNPFLRKLFNHVAGIDIDDRLVTTVDNLAEVFRATNVEALLKNFGRSTQTRDPIIHFYETFLSAYDPEQKKSRGVWYTPEPVVYFMVRGTDDLLKQAFGLREGLASTSTAKIKVQTDKRDNRTKTGYVEIEKDVHKVQVLDPATGTGTFLAQVVKYIHSENFESLQGAWSTYVDNDLIPRLNGFELLMASYSVAHLKLDMLLNETGYSSARKPRLNVFLTNSLEKHHPDTGTLFSTWLSNESKEANRIKRDTPVMIVLGNPPYSIISSNLSAEQKQLIEPFRYIDGKKVKERGSLQLEKNLNDDYVKFIALAKAYVDRTGQGLVSYITNHSFLESRTLRGMRWNLARDFDDIFIIDLHGSAQKNRSRQQSDDDENVFDIESGVCISFFVKHPVKKKERLATVKHFSLRGKRQSKYKWLENSSLLDLDFTEVNPVEPFFEFIPPPQNVVDGYWDGFKLDTLFPLYSSGVITARDKLTVDFDAGNIWKRVADIAKSAPEELRERYSLGKDSTTWKVSLAKEDVLASGPEQSLVIEYAYRIFDTRHTYYTGKVTGFYTNPRRPVMQHMLAGNNVCLVCCKQLISSEFSHAFVSNRVTDDSYLSNRSRERTYCFPLYLEHDKNSSLFSGERELNLNSDVVEKISDSLGLKFSHTTGPGAYSPIDLFDYIYAVLHSSSYRTDFMPYLKKDFPVIPYPNSEKSFFELAAKGKELRELHLLIEKPQIRDAAGYPIAGDNFVSRKIVRKDWELYDSGNRLGRVWINDHQYFDCIPEEAWEFYIGCYQPAQKWLKDRTGRTLSFSEISHYQEIVYSLISTGQIMEGIDEIALTSKPSLQNAAEP